MTMLFVLLFSIILLPSSAWAWGPLTHLYLGSELFSYGPLIPAAVYAVMRQYRQDFLYGNLMADIILGKKYLPDDRSSHSWDVALRLLDQADDGPSKSFVYGYLSHLAADTVAHETLTEEKWDVGHTWVELKADSIIDKAHWLQFIGISKTVQKRNDLVLEGSLDRFIFSFKTNRRIYKGIVLLSLMNRRRARSIDREYIAGLHDESVARMLDLLQNGREASVLTRRPL